MGIYLLIVWVLPTAAAGIFSLRMLARPARVLRSLTGLAACLGTMFGTYVLLLLAESERATIGLAMAGGGVLAIAHLIRLVSALLGKATGGRNKQLFRGLWRRL